VGVSIVGKRNGDAAFSEAQRVLARLDVLDLLESAPQSRRR